MTNTTDREPVAWRWRYRGTNWVYGNDLPVWASSDDCEEEIQPLFLRASPAPDEGMGERVADQGCTVPTAPAREGEG